MHDATATMAPAPPQHMKALGRANEVRLARARIKRGVSDGTVLVADVILQRPWEAANMTLVELLLSQKRWGATKCSKFLATLGLPESKTVGSLTDRQRKLLVSSLSA